MFGLMPGSAPKGIKSQAPCVIEGQLLCPGLGAEGMTVLSEVFWRDRTVPKILWPPGVPIDPRSCCKLESGWSQV